MSASETRAVAAAITEVRDALVLPPDADDALVIRTLLAAWEEMHADAVRQHQQLAVVVAAKEYRQHMDSGEWDGLFDGEWEGLLDDLWVALDALEAAP